MSFKRKVAAAAATLTLVGGVGMAGALTAGSASAATPSCGPSCIDVFSKEFGTHAHPNYVVDVYKQGEKVGQKIILFRTSNYDPAEDFTVAYQGTVADFYAAKMVSAALNLHYSAMPAFENEYAPFGVDSGLCLGVATTAFDDEGVTLQPCGVSANTVWVLDYRDSWSTFTHGGYVPLINGSDTNFSHPEVLTYPNIRYPTDSSRPQLTITPLTGFSQGPNGPELGTVNDDLLWGANFGVLN